MNTTTPSPEPTFLGIRTRKLQEAFDALRRAAAAMPLRGWLTPAPTVCLTFADGQQAHWIDGRLVMAGAGTSPSQSPPRSKTPAFNAFVLPEDAVLRRQLVLPTAAATDLSQAAALEVQSVSPFKADELVWGYVGQTHNETLVAHIALTSKPEIARQAPGLAAHDEVWVLSPGDTAPIVMQGYGEERRRQHIRRWQLIRMALVGLALVVATAVAMTPVVQLRQRAIEARASFVELQKSTAGLLKKREHISLATDQITELEGILKDRINPLQLMAQLTQALPDDTSLLTLQLQGLKLTATGQTANAAALLKRLGTEPWIAGVQAPQAATRPLGSTKDSFSVEIEINPKAFAAPAPAESTPSTSTAVTATSTVATATVTATATPTTVTATATAAPGAAASAPKTRGAP